jgi:hypothetical protein
MFVVNARNGQDLAHRHHDSHEFRRSAIVEHGLPPIHSAMDLQHILARSISDRSGGRVRLPQVQIFGSRVVVSGWAKSYHAIQLALAGLLETYHAMGLDRPGVVELDIEVMSEEAEQQIEAAPPRAR